MAFNIYLKSNLKFMQFNPYKKSKKVPTTRTVKVEHGPFTLVCPVPLRLWQDWCPSSTANNKGVSLCMPQQWGGFGAIWNLPYCAHQSWAFVPLEQVKTLFLSAFCILLSGCPVGHICCLTRPQHYHHFGIVRTYVRVDTYNYAILKSTDCCMYILLYCHTYST